MKRLFAYLLTAAVLGFALAEPAAAAEPTYWQDVRPVLRRHCTVCHSVRNVRELEVSGGLVMDTYDAVLKNKKKALVAPGKSADSYIIQIITTTDLDKRMPLGGKPLPADALAVLKSWIDSGAKEGKRPDTDPTIIVTAPPRRRKLPVVLTTTTTPPAGAFGPVKPAVLQLSMPVGPLAPVAAVTFSPDGKLLAAGAYGRVTIWDMTDLKPAKTLTNVLGTVDNLRFSPDGKRLAVAGGQPSAKGDLRVYYVADWKLLAVLGGHEDVVNSVAWSGDGKRLASASFDKTVRLWDMTTYKQEKLFTDHSDFVYAVAFAPNGEWIASASKDRSVKVFDLATGKSRLTFSGSEQDVLAVAISPDGQRSVVSAGGDPALSWWNTKTGEKVRSQSGHRVGVQELCFSRDGKVVASAGGDGTLRTWDGVTGKPLRSMAVDSLVYACGLSPDGKTAVSGSFDGLVRLWEVSTGRPLVTLLALPPHDADADWLALTPEGYTASSPALKSQMQWRMGSQALAADDVWRVFAKPDLVRKSAHGETPPPPFPK